MAEVKPTMKLGTVEVDLDLSKAAEIVERVGAGVGNAFGQFVDDVLAALRGEDRELDAARERVAGLHLHAMAPCSVKPVVESPCTCPTGWEGDHTTSCRKVAELPEDRVRAFLEGMAERYPDNDLVDEVNGAPLRTGDLRDVLNELEGWRATDEDIDAMAMARAYGAQTAELEALRAARSEASAAIERLEEKLAAARGKAHELAVERDRLAAERDEATSAVIELETELGTVRTELVETKAKVMHVMPTDTSLAEALVRKADEAEKRGRELLSEKHRLNILVGEWRTRALDAEAERDTLKHRLSEVARAVDGVE